MDELEAIRERLRQEILAKAARRSAAPVDLSAQTFEPFLAEHPLAMVDFWAVWCGPCRTTEPVVKEIAQRWAAQVAVGKVNVDEQPSLAQRFRVASIPTFLFFQGGRLAGRLVGAQPPSAFETLLRELVAHPKT